MFEYGFGFGFGGFEILFFLVFFLVFAVIAVGLVKGLMQWNQNNHSPRLNVEATVVTKRMNVSHSMHDQHMHTSSTSYYVTFQVDSGDRMEFHVSGQEYGSLVEGDHGQLSFQGTRYLGFERKF